MKKSFFANITNELQFKAKYPEDIAEIKKLNPKSDYKITVKKVRNPEFHKLVMKYVRTGWLNQEALKSMESYLDYIKVKAGICQVIKHKDYIIAIPGHINFEDLDQIEFQEVFPDILRAICQDLQITLDDLEGLMEASKEIKNEK